MRRTKERPVALPAATAPGLLETLQKCNESLEHVQHNLEAYLEVRWAHGLLTVFTFARKQMCW
jgi:hypothetical protein